MYWNVPFYRGDKIRLNQDFCFYFIFYLTDPLRCSISIIFSYVPPFGTILVGNQFKNHQFSMIHNFTSFPSF